MDHFTKTLFSNLKLSLNFSILQGTSRAFMKAIHIQSLHTVLAFTDRCHLTLNEFQIARARKLRWHQTSETIDTVASLFNDDTSLFKPFFIYAIFVVVMFFSTSP
jgi:hypothetical protein